MKTQRQTHPCETGKRVHGVGKLRGWDERRGGGGGIRGCDCSARYLVTVAHTKTQTQTQTRTQTQDTHAQRHRHRHTHFSERIKQGQENETLSATHYQHIDTVSGLF
jgi:hypothetical protein